MNLMKIDAIIEKDLEEDGSCNNKPSFYPVPRLAKIAFYEENNRPYLLYHGNIGLLLCDEQEQDRLDTLHELFRRVEQAYKRPHPLIPTRNGRILDLGCGTGIWVIDMAYRHPNAYVLGVDIAAIQPQIHPPNCGFHVPFDFERPWFIDGGQWDLIHLQLGCGSITHWTNIYHKVFTYLRPGGWFEQLEIDFEPHGNDLYSKKSAFAYWYRHLKEATKKLGCPLAHSAHRTMEELRQAGFKDVWHHCIMLPLNPWPSDTREKYIGRWYNIAIAESIETLSLAPFTRAFGWPLGTIKQLAADVKLEILQANNHSYNFLHVYLAQKH
ncbi:S-adenosyl-L-methionine-dependent methyltransferase [Aspergillus indologenus CBS 114.80]|uniref:Velvet complex subunit laeA n=1 Tax=Aspergillus indologenus CBS 114.80 TaxID=1450541 RepID=A0A2V5HME6_9EURO|nr:S-adenosyl-L-methionine-dependent methyltransferase [Aspergillus indologenus CBS 114.80]